MLISSFVISPPLVFNAFFGLFQFRLIVAVLIIVHSASGFFISRQILVVVHNASLISGAIVKLMAMQAAVY